MSALGLWTRAHGATPYDDLAVFPVAAQARYDDAWQSVGVANRELGCVYLSGYAVELTMKAAILQLAGVPSASNAYDELRQREADPP